VQHGRHHGRVMLLQGGEGPHGSAVRTPKQPSLQGGEGAAHAEAPPIGAGAPPRPGPAQHCSREQERARMRPHLSAHASTRPSPRVAEAACMKLTSVRVFPVPGGPCHSAEPAPQRHFQRCALALVQRGGCQQRARIAVRTRALYSPALRGSRRPRRGFLDHAIAFRRGRLCLCLERSGT